MAGALSFGGDIASWSPELTQRIRRCVDVYRKHRHLLVQDYFRLLPVPTDDTMFDAAQFISYDRRESILLAYRVLGKPDRQTIRLQGLLEDEYVIESPLSGDRAMTRSGSDLITHGLEVVLPPNQARFLTFRLKDNCLNKDGNKK